MKAFARMLVVVVCGCWICAGASALGEDSAKNFDMDLSYTYLGTHVKNMPLEVRNVPKHNDDAVDSPYGNGQAPIDRLDYDCNHSMALSLMYAHEFGGENGAARYNFGVGMDWLIFPYLIADRQERNYQGDPGTTHRGYGTALTYLELTQDGIVPSTGDSFVDFFLNWAPRAKLEVAPFDGDLKNTWLGVSVSYCSLDAQTGWDRYDSLEVRKDYVLVREFPIRVYLSFLDEKDESGVTVGLEFQPGFYTSQGNEADISIIPVTAFVGVSGRL